MSKRSCFETRKRSIVKTLTFRLSTSLVITPLIVYVFTNNIITGYEVGIVELIVKTLWYYIHERIWSRIKWGYNSSN